MNEYLSAFKKYAAFKGRANRREYWMFVFFHLIVSATLSFVDIKAGLYMSGMGILTGIYIIFMLIPAFSLAVRRLHDIGKSGWNLFLALIPIIGVIILFFFFIKEGEVSKNNYGDTPRPMAA